MATAIQAPADAAGPTSHTQNQPGTTPLYTRQEQKQALEALRVPFTEQEISTRPEFDCKACEVAAPGVCKSHYPIQCEACGQTISVAHTDLRYVGHAQATARLLDVDPFWDWQPMALDRAGLPLLDDKGGLWIRLTVAGITRLGYGDSRGQDRTAGMKELIGNAIRNGGMRFGMALDLWMVDESRARQQRPPGIPEGVSFRLRQLGDWAKGAWGQVDKLRDIHGWAVKEGYDESLIHGPGNILVPFGDLLTERITELENRPSTGGGQQQGPPPGSPLAGQDQSRPDADPETTPDPPHQDEPGETEAADKMAARIFLHWTKPFLLEQDMTEVRRLNLLDNQVEVPEWGGKWVRLEDLITGRIAELQAPDDHTADSGRDAA